ERVLEIADELRPVHHRGAVVLLLARIADRFGREQSDQRVAGQRPADAIDRRADRRTPPHVVLAGARPRRARRACGERPAPRALPCPASRRRHGRYVPAHTASSGPPAATTSTSTETTSAAEVHPASVLTADPPSVCCQRSRTVRAVAASSCGQ